MGFEKQPSTQVRLKLSVDVGWMLEDFERRMEEELKKITPPPFVEPVFYATHGGKRIRPLILLLASRLRGDPSFDPLPAAIAIELLHCESLIHDDVIDRERLRRGRDPFYLKFGPELSLLSADLVLGLSMSLVSRYSDGRLLKAMAKELSRSVIEMCEGELLELTLLRRRRSAWRNYLKVVRLKTAPLFRASAKLGGLIASRGREDFMVKSLAKYGLFLGMAYQVRDDVLDAERGEDVALRVSGVADLKVLEGLCRSFARDAKEALKGLQPSLFKQALCEVVDLAVKRTS